MQMMLLAFTIFTALADPSQVGLQEVNIAMNPDTSNLLQIPLLMDAFNKLDLNHDGLLDKTERKPLTFGMYANAAALLREGDHVTREYFVKNVAVMDFANQEGTEEQCLHEDAVVAMSPEDLWSAIAGEQAWMTVSDFADALYDVAEEDYNLDYTGFQQFAVSHTMPADFHANDRFTLVKLSDYTESHNVKCQVNAVARRQLFVEAALAAAGRVAIAVGIAFVGAGFECALQEILNRNWPNGWMNSLYNQGCTFWQNFGFNLAAEAFTASGYWAWGQVSRYMGWGANRAISRQIGRMTATYGVEPESLGRPILQEMATQTEAAVVNRVEAVVDQAVQTFIPEVSIPSPSGWSPASIIGI